MKISEEGIAISQRFFEAIAMLKEQKKIRGLQSFTKNHGINRWNINQVKFNPGSSVLKPEWIFYIHEDYGVSVEWIVLGKEPVFDPKWKKEKKKKVQKLIPNDK